MLETRPRHLVWAGTALPPRNYTCGGDGIAFSQHLESLRLNSPFQLEKGRKGGQTSNTVQAKTTKANTGQGEKLLSFSKSPTPVPKKERGTERRKRGGKYPKMQGLCASPPATPPFPWWPAHPAPAAICSRQSSLYHSNVSLPLQTRPNLSRMSWPTRASQGHPHFVAELTTNGLPE